MPQTILDPAADPAPAKPLASWYAPGVSDGLGDRLLMFDNTGAPSLELLRFRPELADAAGFEAALREQVLRLAPFQHPAFARVRSVQRLEPDGDLALVSNHTPGKRLSEVLHRARGPAFAAALIRQLAPALAHLQQQYPGVAHGLLSPDRIVVSPDAQLTIVEHVMGPAIESLDLETLPLGSMGIALPPGADAATAALDVATDWYQLGLVTLAALIGRPVTESERPQLERLLDHLSAGAGRERTPLSPFIRQWLDRTLQISGERIASGADARDAVADLLQEEGPREPRRVPRRLTQAPSTRQAATAHPVEAARPVDAAGAADVAPPADAAGPVHGPRPARRSPVPAAVGATATAIPPKVLNEGWREAPGEPGARPVPAPAPRPVKVPVAPPSMFALRSGPDVPGLFSPDLVVPEPKLSPYEREVLAGRISRETMAASDAVPAARGRSVSMSVAAGIALFALVEAGVIAWMVRSSTASPGQALVIETTASGEQVVVSTGAQPAPIQVTLAPDLRWLRVTAPSTQGIVGGTVAATTAATMRILSPIPLKVFEGSRLLGSVPGADLRLLPGRHDLDLVNDTLGFRVQHTVEVKPGQTVSVHVTPAPGSMTVEAPEGTEISVDGQAIGRTPLGPVPLAPGEHQVILRHPKEGSDRQRVTVKPDATTKVVGRLR